MNDKKTLIDFFESQLAAGRYKSHRIYSAALHNLQSFMDRYNGAGGFPSHQFLEAWMVDMCFQGLNFNTALYYLDIASSLYSLAVEEGNAQACEAFSDVKSRMLGLGECIWKVDVSDADLKAFQFSNLGPSKSDAKEKIVRDMILFSLLNRCMPLGSILSLRAGDVAGYSPESQKIISRNAEPRHKYVFPMSQSRLTPRQMCVTAEEAAAGFMGRHFVRMFGDSDNTLKTYWAFAGMKCGLAPHLVKATLGCVPRGLPVLSVCSKMELPLREQYEIAKQIGLVFFNNPSVWFAMRLRRGVKFDRVKRAIFTDVLGKDEIEFFYPTEEIAKKVGKSIKFVERPIIRDIVFFKTSATNVSSIFRAVGKIAWCYKSTRDTGKGYTEISGAAINAFRNAIGHFTPATQLGSVGSLQLLPGDKIVVVGPPFAGYGGEVMEATANNKGTVYRIRLFGDANDIEWRVSNPLQMSVIKKEENYE